MALSTAFPEPGLGVAFSTDHLRASSPPTPQIVLVKGPGGWRRRAWATHQLVQSHFACVLLVACCPVCVCVCVAKQTAYSCPQVRCSPGEAATS